METKSSHVLVGAVVLALIVALFAFILWLSRLQTQQQQEFDVFFRQVGGLSVGSQVQFAGVPAGTVKEIKLLPESPEFVRVRIGIDPDVPILQGTTATIQGVGFTGVSIIQLDGAIKGAPPISEPGPFGVPVIPTRPGALGQLLSGAPELLDRLNTLTAKLNILLDEQNQRSISGILENVDTITGAIAERSDDIAATMAEARVAVRQAGEAATQIARLAETTNRLVESDGAELVANLRSTTARADRTLAELEAMAREARPAVGAFSQQTLPEIGQLVHDLREVTRSVGAITARLDEDPAGALLGGRQLPDYDPSEQR